jgi:hypothetical protein
VSYLIYSTILLDYAPEWKGSTVRGVVVEIRFSLKLAHYLSKTTATSHMYNDTGTATHKEYIYNMGQSSRIKTHIRFSQSQSIMIIRFTWFNKQPE